MSTPELRQKWRDYWNECDRIYAQWWENPILPSMEKLPIYRPRPQTPPFPEELRGLT
ncbi:MAG: hypothetical protein ACFFC7_32355 [Candidatus Hermodarchaeota archaeon]